MHVPREGEDLYTGVDVAADESLISRVLAKIESAASIAEQPPEPIDFDVETILPADDAPALVYGPPASLKSWLALALCDAIVRGVPFLGLKTQRRERALYVNLDAGPRSFRHRVYAASDAPGLDVLSIATSEFNADVLRALLERYAGGFVVIDCLSSIYDPDMRKDASFAMRAFVDDLRALYAKYGCGGLVVDHPHRPKERGELGDYFGSIQKEAAFRTMWSVVAAPIDDGEEAEKKSRRVKISCRKLSEGQPFAPIEVDVDFSGARVAIRRVEADRQPADVRESLLEEKLLTWARDQRNTFSKHSATEAMRGHRAADARKAFDALVKRGDIEDTKQRRGSGTTFRVCGPVSGTTSDHSDHVQETLPVEVCGPVSGTTSDHSDGIGASMWSRHPVPVGDGDDIDTLPAATERTACAFPIGLPGENCKRPGCGIPWDAHQKLGFGSVS